MLKKIGIMQGRLLPKYEGKYQAHPIGYWKDEFPIASKMGLNLIEFILDYNRADENPLLTSLGLEEIKQAEQANKINVKSICADYFMEAPIHSERNDEVDKSLNILEKLINNASLINVTDIIIPCVDQSSLRNEKAIKKFISSIKLVIKSAENKNINLCLETDLPPKRFANLLDSIGSKNVTVNYDIGNSAALGYNPEEEFKAYGSKITDLHIKDRLLGGKSVILGSGNANFPKIFELLTKYDYQGIIIFQAFRDNDGVKIFKNQLNWFYENFKLWQYHQ